MKQSISSSLEINYNKASHQKSVYEAAASHNTAHDATIILSPRAPASDHDHDFGNIGLCIILLNCAIWYANESEPQL